MQPAKFYGNKLPKYLKYFQFFNGVFDIILSVEFFLY